MKTDSNIQSEYLTWESAIDILKLNNSRLYDLILQDKFVLYEFKEFKYVQISVEQIKKDVQNEIFKYNTSNFDPSNNFKHTSTFIVKKSERTIAIEYLSDRISFNAKDINTLAVQLVLNDDPEITNTSSHKTSNLSANDELRHKQREAGVKRNQPYRRTEKYVVNLAIDIITKDPDINYRQLKKDIFNNLEKNDDCQNVKVITIDKYLKRAHKSRKLSLPENAFSKDPTKDRESS
ncbi:MAG: hypothetical protein P9L92_18195 [Candidatus Electryonea clarkiae]|nr:hypothetical protein [Candidatus Electryonea clarkiae]